MSESAEAASSLSEGTDSRAGLHPMSHGLCTLSHVSYATQPRYCRNYALKIYDTRRKRRNAPSVARFSLSSHPWKLISVYRVHNSTVSRLLRYSLTRESVHKPGTWNEAPCAVAKNIMTKHHSSATICLKRQFTKEDKLIPVITIQYILAPKEITDFTGFRTSIRQLFEVLQNAYDKEKMQEVLQNDEKFSNVDRETVEAINLFAGTDIDIDEKEEVIDMCKAWEDQKNEGREEGRELGERQKIISQIVKKLQKDKSVAEIADDLEEKEEVIAPIYEAALSMKPDYDVEKIYELLEKNKKLA